MNDEVTMGELTRRLDRTDEALRLGFADVQASIHALDIITRAEYRSDHTSVLQRIEDLESAQQWLTRTIIGLVLVALIGGVLVAG